MKTLRWTILTVTILGCVLLLTSPQAEAQPAKSSDKQWDELIDKAIVYLKSSQREDGGWSSDKTAGVTGIVLTGLLRSGKVTPDNPMAAKALGYIESLVNTKEGHIAGKDPLKNYVTSVNVMALVAANQQDKYRKAIGDGAEYLKRLQWDEGEGKKADNDFFGGAGYGSKSRPDLSNTHIFLDALKEAGIGPNDPAFKNAMKFVSRCQNLKGEHNDQPWAGKINDGSFIYTAAGGGESKVEGSSPDTGLAGYGSMTYAGVKSLIYCGVAKDDKRVKAAYEWIRNNYTVDANPGMPEEASNRGLYYYYHTMAKCLDALGIDEVVDVKGKKHNWRADIIGALAKRQKPNGSWANDKDQWMEGDPNLVTGYALMALVYCKPKK